MTSSHAFISYAREDEDDARRLAHDLDRDGYAVWLDVEQLVPGDKWELSIQDALGRSSYCIVLLSEAGTRKDSYVAREINVALNYGSRLLRNDRFFIPARLEPVSITEKRLAAFHYIDLFPSWDDGVKRLEMALLMKDVPVRSRTSGGYTLAGAALPVTLSYLLIATGTALDALKDAPPTVRIALFLLMTILPSLIISAIAAAIGWRIARPKTKRTAFFAGLAVGLLFLFFVMMLGEEP